MTKVTCSLCGNDITHISNKWGIWHGVGLCTKGNDGK